MDFPVRAFVSWQIATNSGSAVKSHFSISQMQRWHPPRARSDPFATPHTWAGRELLAQLVPRAGSRRACAPAARTAAADAVDADGRRHRQSFARPRAGEERAGARLA